LYKELDVDCVIGCGIHIKQNYDWGLVSKEIGVPYIVLHKENFAASKQREEKHFNTAKLLNKYNGNHIIVHNNIMKDLYIKAGLVKPEQISSLGSLRMDDLIRKIKSYQKKIKDRKKVVLFSFHYGIGFADIVKPGFANRDFGLIELFEHVHATFAKMAVQNRDIDFTIKPKWGGDWIDEIKYVCNKNNFDVENIENLSIEHNIDVHELIFDSDVICGYGSTSLLEAAIVGTPVIMPYFDEIVEKENEFRVILKDHFHVFDIAYSVIEFEKLILERVHYRPDVSQTQMKERYDLFEKYISPIKGNSLEKYIKVINSVIEREKKLL
jgi:hypothetical protein